MQLLMIIDVARFRNNGASGRGARAPLRAASPLLAASLAASFGLVAVACSDDDSEAGDGEGEESGEGEAGSFSESGAIEVDGDVIEYEGLTCILAGGDDYTATIRGYGDGSGGFEVRIEKGDFAELEVTLTTDIDDDREPLGQWVSGSRGYHDGWEPMDIGMDDYGRFEFPVEGGRAAGTVPVVLAIDDGENVRLTQGDVDDWNDPPEPTWTEVEIDIPVPETPEDCDR